MRKEYQKSYREKNKERIIIRQKKYYQNNKERLIKKQRQYYQDNKEEVKRKNIQYSRTPPGIYCEVKRSAKRKNLDFCDKQEFVDWYNKQKMECNYCDIPINLLKKIDWVPNAYKHRFTIDRKNNSLGYILNNICLSCIVCNRIKGPYWTSKETKIMAQRELKPLWKKNYECQR